MRYWGVGKKFLATAANESDTFRLFSEAGFWSLAKSRRYVALPSP